MVKLFGWLIQRDNEKVDRPAAIVDREMDDGAALAYNGVTGSFYSQHSTFDVAKFDEIEIITKYRNLAANPEIDHAVDDIVNEAFSYDEKNTPISINLDFIDNKVLPLKTKKQVKEEFDNILKLMSFRSNCYQIFKKWYIDGRLYYEVIIDKDNPKDGIQELRYIDPRKIKKIREIIVNNEKTYTGYTQKNYRTYFIYNPAGVVNTNATGIKISPDSIAYCDSGVLDATNSIVLSYLHQALRPFQQYTIMKDAMVIYYQTRAPERRVFNFEVGGLPKNMAEQAMNDQIQKLRRQPSYNPRTGEVDDEKRYPTMQQDFWFAMRDGKGTRVDVLAGGANLAEIKEVVDSYKNELFESLNLPKSRYQDGVNFNIGRPSEITRDELKFSKFISRLRKNFAKIFDELLGRQLILKNILTEEEWNGVKEDIYYDWLEDSFFTEFKWSEVLAQRMNTFRDIESYVGNWVSRDYVYKKVLQFDDDEIKKIKEQIEKEKKENPPENFGFDGMNNELPPEGEDTQDSLPNDVSNEEEPPEKEMK